MSGIWAPNVQFLRIELQHSFQRVNWHFHTGRLMPEAWPAVLLRVLPASTQGHYPHGRRRRWAGSSIASSGLDSRPKLLPMPFGRLENCFKWHEALQKLLQILEAMPEASLPEKQAFFITSHAILEAVPSTFLQSWNQSSAVSCKIWSHECTCPSYFASVLLATS